MKISELLNETAQPKKPAQKQSSLPSAPRARSIDDEQPPKTSKKAVLKNEYDAEGFNQQGVNRWGATREEAKDYDNMITGDLATDNKIWMAMGEMNGLNQFADNQPYDLADAVEKICSPEQIDEIVEDLGDNPYYTYKDLVTELQLIRLQKTGDNNIWSEIVSFDISNILDVPENLLQNDQFAIAIIDAAKEFAEMMDKHYIRTGALEDYGNDANKLMKSWASSVTLSPRVKKHLNDLIRQKMFSIS